MEELVLCHEWMHDRGGAEVVAQQLASSVGAGEMWVAAFHPRWRDSPLSMLAPDASCSAEDYFALFKSISQGIGARASAVRIPPCRFLLRSHHHFSGQFIVEAEREAAYVHSVPRLWWEPDKVPWERRLIDDSDWLAGRELDFLQAQRADIILCNGRTTQRKIAKYYGRSDATIVSPPVPAGARKSTHIRSHTLLSVSRLVEGKRLEAAIEAARSTGHRWTIAGTGRSHGPLALAAKDVPNITLVGDLPSTSINQLIARASAFLSLGEEEFGISTHQALMSDTPVIVAHDSEVASLVEGLGCGIAVNPQDASEIADALLRVRSLKIDWAQVSAVVSQYSFRSFRDSLMSSLAAR